MYASDGSYAGSCHRSNGPFGCTVQISPVLSVCRRIISDVDTNGDCPRLPARYPGAQDSSVLPATVSKQTLYWKVLYLSGSCSSNWAAEGAILQLALCANVSDTVSVQFSKRADHSQLSLRDGRGKASIISMHDELYVPILTAAVRIRLVLGCLRSTSRGSGRFASLSTCQFQNCVLQKGLMVYAKNVRRLDCSITH